MKRIMTRILTLVLCFALCFAMSVPSFAAGSNVTVTAQDVSYSESAQTVTVTITVDPGADITAFSGNVSVPANWSVNGDIKVTGTDSHNNTINEYATPTATNNYSFAGVKQAGMKATAVEITYNIPAAASGTFTLGAENLILSKDGTNQLDGNNNGITATTSITLTPSGSTSLTVTAGLTPDKTSYSVGDTVTVTVALIPSDAATLSSGSVKFTYDTANLTFTSATANTALGTGAHATLFNDTAGTCVASFTSDGTAQSVSTTGLTLATFTFKALEQTAGTALTVTETVAAGENAAALATANGNGASFVIGAANTWRIASFGGDVNLVKYTVNEMPSSGAYPVYNGEAMTYVPAYANGASNVYVFVAVTTDAAVVSANCATNGTVLTTLTTATGDANKDSSTNIIDAQVVIYLAGKTLTGLTAYDWLNSDVNGDGVIDALDAQAIQYYVHYGVFGKFS